MPRASRRTEAKAGWWSESGRDVPAHRTAWRQLHTHQECRDPQRQAVAVHFTSDPVRKADSISLEASKRKYVREIRQDRLAYVFVEPYSAEALGPDVAGQVLLFQLRAAP
ncbi:hypothetical protein NDU88_008148 [Pleurodeles waltl]|uniref:Uncharacterized protein n=1 Tax=Pleurodeles waltl TaxID=8319 RepID=A0AAV7N460_PLEWA|nr:hypothetical protein NDU88_008148 [Pleurodeles waltl]